jgi:hypothetical protein
MVASYGPRELTQLAEIIRRMQEEDIQALRAAMATLEHPGFAARLAEIAGKPIELFNRALPETASKAIAVATTQAGPQHGSEGGASHHAKRAQEGPL